MNCRLISSPPVVFTLALVLAGAARGQSQLSPPPVPGTEADVPVVSDEVAQAIERLDAWLGQNENAARWRRFLGTQELQRELARGRDANPAIVGRALQRLRGRERGLELGPFTTLRDALDRRVEELADQYTGDLTDLAWTSREDYRAMSQADLEDVRTTLRNRANQLMQWLGGDSERARRWRAYLKWDYAAPHLEEGYRVTPRSLAELDEALEQFQTNVYGLEMAPFRQTAEALARYRILAPWAVAGETRDTRVDYERLLDTLRKQLERHVQEPTTETAWKIGRILTTIDQLDRSPWLISLIRRRFAQPNITAAVSEQLTRSLEDEPANQVTSVRDCILGTRIVGTAHTLGEVRYQLQPSDDSVQLALYVTGAAHSQTNGYNGPVRINSTGTTPFRAFKQINLDETAFRSTPAVVTADTNTRIHSIQKINGRFGERLVEKIAWRRAMEQKRQAERISARHAEQRIAGEINQRADQQLAQLRRRYEQEFLAPLARRAITPEAINLSSTRHSVAMTTTFARPNQLAATGDPPAPRPGHDILVQVHQSAINNYLPLALARARISQQSADRPIDLEGNVPNWLRATAIVAPKVAAAVEEGIDVVEETQEAVEELTQPEEEDGADGRELPPFKPYSITLNAEAPASVWFDDGRVKIRIRASHLVSEENEYTNWDFIVTYDVLLQHEQIILRRVGEIEVFPTGFDPAWDKQLTGQQAGFRSTLAKNMNARAEAGESFPKEIPIQPLQVTRLGVLLVNELTVDDGWLTVGWILPPRGQAAPAGAGILQAPETPIVP